MDLYNKVVEKWQSYDIKNINDLETYLTSFKILFAYNSSKIENDKVTYDDTREIFENGKIVNYTGDVRTIFEQQNQKYCYDYLKEKIIKKEKLSIELIKKMHKILTDGTYDEVRYAKGERAGTYKINDYVTGLYEVGSKPNEVEKDMNDLIEEINNINSSNIFRIATYFHAKFEYIHPFADGNGRAGRTLMNYLLMINNHPPLIVYEEDRKEYYNALRTYDSEENINVLEEFLKNQLIKTWSRIMRLYNNKTNEKSFDDLELEI